VRFFRRRPQFETLDLGLTIRRAEVRVYDDRTYVCGDWSSDWFARVDATDADEVGRLVLAVFDGARSQDRPPKDRHEPDVRIDLYEHGDGVLHVRPLVRGRPDPDREIKLPFPAFAAAIGATVGQLLETTEPIYPVLASASVHDAGDVLVVYGTALVALPPVRVLTKPAAQDSLRAALDAALHASAAARGLSEQRRDRAHEDWKRELSDSGLRYNDLLGRPLIHVGRNRVGGHEVESWKPDGRGWAGSGAETVLGPDEDVAAAVAALVGAPAAAARAPAVTGSAFGPKTAWLAVRDGDPAALAGALGLAKLRDAGWEEGVAAAYDEDGAVFVSPATSGWVFAVGGALAEADVAAVARTLGGEVQHFGTHRVSGYAIWARYVQGTLVRRVHVADGEVQEEGEPTPIELELDATLPEADEEEVLRVAAAWSVDPLTLHTVESSSPDGLLGRLPTG